MHHKLSLSAALVCLFTAAAVAQEKCAPVNIIVARGSTEPQGLGLLGTLANDTSKKIPGSVVTALVYPAQLSPYPPSVAQGTGNMTQLLNEQAQKCPNTKLVLMGYSQGAQVSLDTLCGTDDGATFTSTEAQASKVGKQIAAVVLFGDPTYVAGKPLNKGTSKKDGIFPRKEMTACDSLTSKFISFCDDNDLFCASGNDLSVHLSYFSNQKYMDEASSFVVQNTK